MEDKRFEVVSQEGNGFSYLRAILVDKETGEIIPSYISIDRQTNEVTFLPVKDVPTMTGIGQTKFTEHEIGELRAGRAIPSKEVVLS